MAAPRPASRGALGLRGQMAPWPNALPLAETAGTEAQAAVATPYGPGPVRRPGHGALGLIRALGLTGALGLISAAESRPVWSREGRACPDRHIGKAVQRANAAGECRGGLAARCRGSSLRTKVP